MERIDNIVAERGESEVQRGDPMPLVDSIRESVQAMIAEINRAAEFEMRETDQRANDEIAKFRESQAVRHRETLNAEEQRTGNLAATAVKKERLEGLESFINAVIKDVTAAIRSDMRYAEFLADCVIPALENFRGKRVSILVSEEDGELLESMKGRIAQACPDAEYTVKPELKAGGGGAMVIDEENGVIFNNTVERIVFRNRDRIRREIVRLLEERRNEMEGLR